MNFSKNKLFLSLILAFFLALAAYLGAFLDSSYALEARNWAEQGRAQDLVTLFLVVPLLLFSAFRAYKGSFAFLLIYMGALLYNIYSYILYAMFVHFGTWFLLYVAILGMSFYLFLFCLAALDYVRVNDRFSSLKTKEVSWLLIFISVLFNLMWLQEIIVGLVSSSVPKSLQETGLIVNPIHVLDLALLLPGAFLVGFYLQKDKIFARILALPLLSFFVLMGLAIIAMAINTTDDMGSILPVLVFMSLLVLLNIVVGFRFFRSVNS